MIFFILAQSVADTTTDSSMSGITKILYPDNTKEALGNGASFVF